MFERQAHQGIGKQHWTANKPAVWFSSSFFRNDHSLRMSCGVSIPCSLFRGVLRFHWRSAVLHVRWRRRVSTALHTFTKQNQNEYDNSFQAQNQGWMHLSEWSSLSRLRPSGVPSWLKRKRHVPLFTETAASEVAPRSERFTRTWRVRLSVDPRVLHRSRGAWDHDLLHAARTLLHR